MKSYPSFFFILLAVILLISCERIFIAPNEKSTPINNFNELWSELDKGYVYFDYKGIDWDSVKREFELRISSDMTDQQLFNTLAEMLETLKDGHNSIRQDLIRNRSYDFTVGFEANFNKDFVINQYLLPNDMDTTTWIRHCFLKPDIGYLYYSTFTNEITEEGMDEILNKYENTKGLIIDVRGNKGGDASNILRIMEHFISSPTLVAYSQEKTGEGRDELSSPKEVWISPAGVSYDKPLIVLTNRECYSACNAFAAYMSLLPNVTLVGDFSGGGAGLPVAQQLWNGWFFTYSSSIGYLPDGFILENGIAPDIYTATNEVQESMGIDSLIERAILELQ